MSCSEDKQILKEITLERNEHTPKIEECQSVHLPRPD